MMTEPGARSRKRFTVDELFSDTRPQASGVRDLHEAKIIDLDRIHPDPVQPRRTFDPERLEELAASIRAEGVLQPVVVRFDSEHDRYVIVHGERRWRASRIAGLARLPAIVKEVPAERRLVQQLMENVLRDDLNAVDRAAALRGLRSQLGEPAWEVVAEAVGIKRSRLFQLLGTGKLSKEAQEDIQAGRLSEKQSRALQGLSETKQQALKAMILTSHLSAQSAMRIARAFKGMDVSPPDDIDAATRVLAQVHGFVFATSDDQVQAQTRVLLGAVRNAASGSTRARNQLKSIASTLDAQTFREDRFGQELNAIARTLASLPLSADLRSSSVDDALRELSDALAALLGDSRSTSEDL
jgi:ParB/RepB/Spo0J family partition protein